MLRRACGYIVLFTWGPVAMLALHACITGLHLSDWLLLRGTLSQKTMAVMVDNAVYRMRFQRSIADLRTQMANALGL